MQSNKAWKRTLAGTIALIATIALLTSSTRAVETETEAKPNAQSRSSIEPPSNHREAHARARLLHEMTVGSLAVMHRDFFDEDDAGAIPSASLEDVFVEMERTYGVEMKWLVVNTDVVNVDHEPETAFDQFAVKQLAAGRPFSEQSKATRYHFAGAIRLGSQCLKCHVKRRTSNEDRTAGLVITMPIQE